jgi:NhaP-type Na+/H+ or K+/H+ antiporter
MSFTGWLAIGGALLLTMALSSALIRRLPISSAAIYLCVGVALGPWGFDLLRIDLQQDAGWIERLTEIAVILALFVGGLRLRLPLRDRAWRASYRLASILMIATIVGVVAAASVLLDFNLGTALVLGAILAPTDPVLASSVTVGHAQDNDHLRYALSGEAGLNDGTAFPFVVLGLLVLHAPPTLAGLAGWFGYRVLWAVPAGLAVGYVLGRLVGITAIKLRTRDRDTAAPTDFLALALIALSYTGAQAIGGWGFLAVFAAGLGLRHVEVSTVESAPHPQAQQNPASEHPPAETLVSPNTVTEHDMKEPAVAAGVLVAEAFSFGDALERVLEVLLVALVGISLANHFDARGLLLGAALIVIVRPVATWLSLLGSSTTRLQMLLIGWFGIRGIGSVYYLAYALTHGVEAGAARELADVTITAIALSVVVHGLTAQPLMNWYDRRQPARNTVPLRRRLDLAPSGLTGEGAERGVFQSHDARNPPE